MENDFTIKLIESLEKSLNQVEILQHPDTIKLSSECIYCGRSAHGLPHLGIVISQQPDNKITGGVNCFRCGTSKSLKEFLYDFQQSISFFGISKSDIDNHVVVVESEEKSFKLNFNAVTKTGFIEQNKFYNWLKHKYENDTKELRRRIFYNVNGFVFLKNKLKLNFDVTIYNAYRILKDVKARSYLGQSGFPILSFDEKFRYIFDKSEPKFLDLFDQRDIELFKSNKIPYVFHSYIKKKNPIKDGIKYYIVKDTNCDTNENFDIMNVYVCEGVFDTLTMKFYKNIFDLKQVNRIEKNIFNLYVAIGHTGVDRFVSKYFLGLNNDSTNLPTGIKEVNFIIVPDLNINVQKYIFSLYKFFKKEYNSILGRTDGLKIKGYYLDLKDSVACYDSIKDVNDVIRQFNKRMLRNIKLVEIF